MGNDPTLALDELFDDPERSVAEPSPIPAVDRTVCDGTELAVDHVSGLVRPHGGPVDATGEAAL
ncbi:hypothetical protein [Streptomyces werraensis]|uniref:hypothetical protein n=1 Tax=Streptomyces werraensis TaxID=68284 RepID=UPI001CE324F3